MKIEKDIEYIRERQAEHANDTKETKRMITEFLLAYEKDKEELIQENDARYASKVVEKVVYGGVGVVLVTILGFGLRYLFK